MARPSCGELFHLALRMTLPYCPPTRPTRTLPHVRDVQASGAQRRAVDAMCNRRWRFSMYSPRT